MKTNYSQDLIAELVFDRTSATFKPQETVTGQIKLAHKSNSAFKVDVSSLKIIPTGKMTLHARHNNKKIEEVVKDVQQISMMNVEPLELAKNKTLSQTSNLSFRFKLNKNQHRFIETYVGVYITIVYEIEVVVKFLNTYGTITENFPFYIQVPKQGRQTIQNFVYPKKKNFMIVSDDIKGEKVPKFKIKGELQSEICYFNEDLNGLIIVDQAESPIRSIDVQMYRVQKINLLKGSTIVERTQIQMIQMCDGNVTRNMELPIYMILPRYYACPSFKYMWAEVDFQVDLIIVFRNGFKVTVNIPLKLIRS